MALKGETKEIEWPAILNKNPSFLLCFPCDWMLPLEEKCSVFLLR